MKKKLKIFGITLLSIIAVAVIAVCIVVWIVFTPAKLTPIVRNQIPNFVTCQTELDTVDLTFFSTFPKFGLRINNLAIINPVKGAQSDTVAKIGACIATIDVAEYLSKNNVLIDGFYLQNTQANLFVNSENVANYDIFVSDTTTEDTSSSELFSALNLRKILLENIEASYVDVPSNINASIADLNLDAEASMKNNIIDAEVELNTQNIAFALTDSSQLQATTGVTEFEFKGEIENFNNIKGNLKKLHLANVHASMEGTTYADSLITDVTIPDFIFSLDSMKVALAEAVIGLNEHKISLSGKACVADEISMNMDFSTNEIVLNRFLKLVPEQMIKEYLDGINLDGNVKVAGNVKGKYNDSLMPNISADVTYTEGNVKIEGLGHDLYDVSAIVHANIDLNEEGNSSIELSSVTAKTGKSTISATGKITDLLNEMNFDIKAKARLFLLDVKADIPEYIFASGWADAKIAAKCNMEQLENVDLQHIQASGNIVLTDFDAIYEDSTFVSSPKLSVDFKLPSTRKSNHFTELIEAKIAGDKLNLEMLDFLKTDLHDTKLEIGLSDVMDTTKDMAMSCKFDIQKVNVAMESDTVYATILNPNGQAEMYPKAKNTGYVCVFNCDSLSAKVAEEISARTGVINVDAKAEYNEKETDMILQWNPDVKLNFNQGQFAISGLNVPVKISKILCDFNKDRFKINQSQMIVGNSDFELTGTINNIAEYLKDEALLVGRMDFVSNYTDVMELMDLTSGLGDTTTVEVVTDENVAAVTVVDSSATASSDQVDNPFMVPLGVDFVLNTKIKKAVVGNTIIENAGGGVTIKDGVLLLEEMGFTCDAAQMQLTAMYRSERKNHLFAGLDFHLIDINISDLIEIIPDIDTIVPMLKSFSGKAEFHFAAETYLKSNYDPKFSTMRGAAAIKGENLVVMDNETFDMISKKLLFNKKKTKNVIDSLSVEMTMFRNEVDLYPFVVSMDKYQAVLAGYHNLDMTYNYHVSLTKCPLPIRLGLNILGTVDDMKFKLGRCKYGKLYKPEKRGVVDEQILALKKTISSSLQAGVKDQSVLIKE